MEIRIPKAVLLVLGVLVVLGGAAAIAFATGAFDSEEDRPECVNEDSGVPLDCGGANAVTPEQYAEAEAERAKALAKAQECESQVGDFISELEELDSRLSVGLSFAEHSRQVGNIRVAYDQVPIGQLDFPCLSGVGVDAEEAMNKYVKADNVWSNCISDFGCDTDSIDPQLQSNWSAATQAINQANSGLRELRTP